MNFVKGMDLSTLAELEKCGAKYYDNGEEKDLLEIMKSYDVDTIRIRVWNDPWSEAGESYGEVILAGNLRNTHSCFLILICSNMKCHRSDIRDIKIQLTRITCISKK